MGSYINVKSKAGFANLINELWAEQFDGFLIYTPKIIKKEINLCSENKNFQIRTIKEWNDNFIILAQNKGQLFFKSDITEEEKKILIEKVNFIINNRMLFKTIRNIQEAAYSLGMNFNFDHFENGEIKKDIIVDFSNSPEHPLNPVYKICKQFNLFNLWDAYQDIFNKGMSLKRWENIKNKIIPNTFSTVLQRCEYILAVKENRSSDLNIHINAQKLPSKEDIFNVITMTEDQFNTFLNNLYQKTK